MKHLVLLLVLIIAINLFSQKNNFDFFSIEQGLPHSTIYSLLQDSRGYLWIGSDGGGVSKFDGNKFTNYNRKNGLIGNTVRDIFEDKNKNIWFGTLSGISCYNGFEVVSYDTTDGLSSNAIFCLNQDNNNNILIGTAQGGLNILNTDSLSIKSYTTDDGLNSNNVFSIITDSLNRIWLFYYGGQPQIISFKNDSIIIEEMNTSFFDISIVLSGKLDKDGNIWIGTQDNGVYKITDYSDLANTTVEALTIMDGLSDNCIWSIDFNNNQVFLGTNKGVNIIDKHGISFINKNIGLLSNEIMQIFIDNEKNIWVSMLENGLAKLKGYEFSHFTTKDGLLSNEISNIRELEDSTLLISTFDKGLGIYKINGNTLINTSKILSDKNISSFDIDKQNNLWIGTSEGLALVNKNQTTFFTTTDFLAHNKVNDVFVDHKDVVWVATSGGVSFFNGIEIRSFNESQGLINNEVQTIIEDSAKNLWIGTLGGLVKFNKERNTSVDFDEKDGLDYKRIHSLACDNKDNIWIGTFGNGLYLFDKNLDSINIKQVLTDSSLLSNNIYSLVFINDTTLIVGTDRGFNKLTIKDKTITNVVSYDKYRGFKFIEHNLNAIYHSKYNNTVYFGTTNGLTLYKPNLENSNTTNPLIHLSKIKLFNREVVWKNDYQINRWNKTPKDLELDYNKNFLTFIFEGISFKNPQSIKYLYKLEGLSDKWFPVENELTFQSLGYGEYTLYIKAVNSNNISSINPVKYKFTINPPFYFTWWFIITSLLVILVSLIVIFRLRLAKLKKDKNILETIVKERTAEVVKQKDIIEEKNKDITDSIRYAKRIQSALMPSSAKLNSYFNEHFVLFKPKDIVSGDYYWANKVNNKILFSAADCTGHGVPGSIMSIIGNSGLENVVKNNNSISANSIMDSLNEFVISTFKQSDEINIKDGMDMALCIFDKDKMQLEYSGAHNPLYLIRSKQNGFDEILNEDSLNISDDDYNLFEIKADKQPIGDFEYRVPFKQHVINLLPGDTIYTFSDGYADQFGGPKGKKFKYKPFKRILLGLQSEDMEQQKLALDKHIEDWMNFENEYFEQIDDIIIFGVRF